MEKLLAGKIHYLNIIIFVIPTGGMHRMVRHEVEGSSNFRIREDSSALPAESGSLGMTSLFLLYKKEISRDN
jgi:hypothetical protein